MFLPYKDDHTIVSRQLRVLGVTWIHRHHTISGLNSENVQHTQSTHIHGWCANTIRMTKKAEPW